MISRDNFPTGDFVMSPVCYAVFAIPDEDWIKRILLGAVLMTLDDDHWTERGTATPSTATAIFEAIYESFECVPNLTGGNVNIGTVYPVAYDNPQANELACNGGTYARVDYPELYALLNSAFKIDADYFKTPDLRTRVVAGPGDIFPTGTHAVGDTVGAERVTLTTNEIPPHFHEHLLRPLSTQSGGQGTGIGATTAGTYNFGKTTTWNAGGGASHNNLQPTLYLNYMIRANDL